MKTALFVVSLLAAMALPSAQAAPILYTITFDASNAAAGAAGDSGTGSFSYDATTNQMTNLVWDFGPGETGGVSDAGLASLDTGQYMFESIFFNSSDPTLTGSFISFIAAFGLFGPFPSEEANFCRGTLNPVCHMAPSITGQVSYEFIDSGDVAPEIHRGYLTVTPATTVPEPATLALIGLGLAGLGFARRRKLN